MSSNREQGAFLEPPDAVLKYGCMFFWIERPKLYQIIKAVCGPKKLRTTVKIECRMRIEYQIPTFKGSGGDY